MTRSKAETERGADRRWHLTVENLGSVEFVSGDAFDRIVDATGLEVARTIDRVRARVALNNLVRRTMVRQMEGRMNRSHLDELSKRASRLFTYIDDLKHFDIPPPRTYARFRQNLQEYAAELDQMIEARSRGGRPPQPLKVIFVPRALGVFHVLFGEEPTSYARGPAARFIQGCVSEVRAALDHLGVRQVQEDLRRLLAEWSPPDGENLEMWVRGGKTEACALPDGPGMRTVSHGASGDIQDPMSVQWRLYAALYADECRLS